MKKRLLATILAAFMLLSMSACNNANEENVPDNTQDNNATNNDIVEEVPVEVFEENYIREEDGFEFSSEKGVIAEYPAILEKQLVEIPVEFVSDDYLASIDAKAEEMKNNVLSTVSDIKPTGEGLRFFVSEDGDDSNSGLAPSLAWKTLKNVNNSPLIKPGSVIYFERGGVWRGQLKTKPGVSYTAYGEGNKPCLYGSPENGADPSMWELVFENNLTGSKIWKYKNKLMDSGTLVFNDGDLGCAYKEVPNYINGKYMLRRNNSVEFDYRKELDNDLEMFQTADSLIINGVPSVGDTNNVGFIYLRCDKGNPGEVFDSIEFLPRMNGFAVGGNADVTIDNFCVKYVGSHGVGAGTCKNLTVKNCEFAWIGGGIQTFQFRGDTTGRVTRYGNAIEIYGGCEGFYVDNNYIYQIYDAGITHQVGVDNGDKVYLMNDVYYTNNIVEYCTYSIEYFLSGVKEGNDSMMNNINMTDNLLRFSGNGWGEQRPDTGSAAHIKSWSSSNPSKDFTIERNILDRGYHRLLHIASTFEEHLPAMDSNVYIQYYGAKLGMFGVGNPQEVFFDENVATAINEGAIKDENAEIYYAKPTEGSAVFAPSADLEEYIDTLPSFSYTAADGTLIPFRVIYPANYKKEDKLPMVLYFHSEYQHGRDNRDPARLNAEIVKSAYSLWATGSSKCIILVPQCPEDYDWVNTKLAPTYSMDEVGESRHLKAVVELLPKAIEKFGADADRISVAGISKGGTAAWDVLMRHPELFKKAAIVCGGIDTTHIDALKNIEEINVFHGTNDVKVRIGEITKAVEAMQAAGISVIFTPLQDQMHDCWKQAFTNSFVKGFIG